MNVHEECVCLQSRGRPPRLSTAPVHAYIMLVRAIAGFQPAPGMVHEMPLALGDRVILLEQPAPDGWVYVQRTQRFYNDNSNGLAWQHWPAGSTGLVPASFLRVVDEERSEEEEEEEEEEESREPTEDKHEEEPSAPALDSPAGLFATTSGGCGLAALRARCTDRNLPYSISDRWRTLDLRLALDAAIEAAQGLSDDDGVSGATGDDTCEELLRWPPLATSRGQSRATTWTCAGTRGGEQVRGERPCATVILGDSVG